MILFDAHNFPFRLDGTHFHSIRLVDMNAPNGNLITTRGPCKIYELRLYNLRPRVFLLQKSSRNYYYDIF